MKLHMCVQVTVVIIEQMCSIYTICGIFGAYITYLITDICCTAASVQKKKEPVKTPQPKKVKEMPVKTEEYSTSDDSSELGKNLDFELLCCSIEYKIISHFNNKKYKYLHINTILAHLSGH